VFLISRVGVIPPILHIQFRLSTTLFRMGRGSSVGIATGYGLGGAGSNPGEDEIFCPSRSAL